jgi:AcrR family transcriptional regulator
LLSRAIEVLAEQGVEGLTFRAVARAAGVSATSPYRYFADRQAFLAAVAEEGFRRLIEAMRERESADLESFRQMATTYLDFALANQGLYELMFSARASEANTLPWLLAGSRGLVEFLAGRIRALQRSELVGPGDPASLAVASWATLHGMARIALDGLSDGLGATVHDFGRDAVRMMTQGIARRPEAAGGRARAS